MNRTIIIAEAGVNHNGDVNLAKRMICEAKKAGADIVKFQTFKTENIVTTSAKKADYQNKYTTKEETQFEMLKNLELTEDDHYILKEYCEKLGISFLSTPFDLESIDFLESLNIPFFKVPSGEITNLPYLVKIAKTRKPVIMSSGMSNLEEIHEAIEILRKYGTSEISLLHCNSQYPTPFKDVNLRAMVNLEKRFNINIGYSDHTLGIEVPIAAVALGATIIEKHVTLDRNMEGPDHKASLEFNELKTMIDAIRNIEIALGTNEKKVTESEVLNKVVVRKSIVAKSKIHKGEFFTEENLTVKRPGTGISPMKWYDVIGMKAIKDFEKDELIEL
ncbi:N-acetylneuraminate synthase [Bacillus sp. BRMEA1]|uniref:N-acetylneuraminate synthase n=1 Tax=Neobacillus endophyticus TaxID=2738405 RepID=UPI0015649F7C|nr:N-acetylneuraminate synthase [Neobacillus endophyticus]NRD79386.1 N-acetylneuraminate synthase [Neobacillus endophyticus]